MISKRDQQDLADAMQNFDDLLEVVNKIVNNEVEGAHDDGYEEGYNDAYNGFAD